MAIQRQLEGAVSEYLGGKARHCNVLLLSGARQVGKSTLVAKMLGDDSATFLNLSESSRLPAMIDATESFEEFERLLLREVNFKPSAGRVLVIDEAQEARRLGRWLRFFKEKWEGQKVIILGSILSNLFDDGATYPVGHVEEVVLRPFTFKEFLRAGKREGLIEIVESATLARPISEADRDAIIKPYLDYLNTGGMPEIAINSIEGKESAFAALDRLLRHYALDVERYMGEAFRTILTTAMERIVGTTCHPIKNSQIISTDSASYRRVPRLLEVLEKWHLVHRVSVQTKHPESATGIASKRYLFDVGLANFFINHGGRVEWADRSAAGNLVYPKLQENFVCNEIVAGSAAPLSALNYYRETRGSQEIDFIVRIGSTMVPVEVKSQRTLSRNGLVPMLNYLTQRRLKVGFLIYNGEMKSVRAGDCTIHAIPPFLASEMGRLVE